MNPQVATATIIQLKDGNDDPEETEIGMCENCYFFEEALTVFRRRPKGSGACRRFPFTLYKRTFDWCGEHEFVDQENQT